jgi:hypothetical protein
VGTRKCLRTSAIGGQYTGKVEWSSEDLTKFGR